MDVLELIKEPVFLVVSTGLSLLMAIIANLLTPKCNKLLSKLFSSLRSKQSEKKAIYISKIISAAMDGNKIVNIKLDVAYILLKSLVMIVFSLFLFSISPYIHPLEYIFIFISLCLVTYAISLFNSAQIDYKIAVMATLRTEQMTYIRDQLNAQYQAPDEYEDHYDNEDEMYKESLAKWDKENL